MQTLFLSIDSSLSLHHPNPDWAKTIFEIIDEERAHLEKWLPWVDKTISEKDTLSFLKEARAFNKYGQNLTTFIFLHQQIIGSVAFNRFDKKNNSGEVGYWLRQGFQGKGLMTKACATLIQFGFEKRHLNRIEIKVASSNTKSKAIPQRLGFQHEGTLREAIFRNEQYHDLDIFAKLKASPNS